MTVKQRLLAPGIYKYGHAKLNKKKGLHKILAKEKKEKLNKLQAAKKIRIAAIEARIAKRKASGKEVIVKPTEKAALLKWRRERKHAAAKKLREIRKKRKLAKRKPKYTVKPIGGEKNGGERKVLNKKPTAFYATQPRSRSRQKTNLFRKHKRYLRKTLMPGTVCIALAGVHKGKRVIFLKQLASGLCLITGPFRLNGCPLRRINQVYLIATSTRLKMGKIKIPERIKDQYFKRTKKIVKKPKKSAEGDIFKKQKEKYVVTLRRKKDQRFVDTQILKYIRARPDWKKFACYLRARFCLRNKQYPHDMKF